VRSPQQRIHPGLNYRLLFAGQALLGKSFPDSTNGQEAYNKGLDAPRIDSQEPVDTAVSRGQKTEEKKSTNAQTAATIEADMQRHGIANGAEPRRVGEAMHRQN